MRKVVLSSALAALLLTGCGATNQEVGTVTGAGLGGLVGVIAGKTIGGNDVLMGVGGAIIGAWLGSQLGASMDQADRNAAAIAQQRALEGSPDGQPVLWNNPNSGARGQVVPTSTTQRPDGRYCREFQHDVFIDGKAQKAYGTACRQPDGSWQIIQ